MGFFKKRKELTANNNLFSTPDINAWFGGNKESSTSRIEEVKKDNAVFDQAAELYTKAQNILNDHDPTELDEESQKKYFELLMKSYSKLLSRAHNPDIYLSLKFCRLFLMLHKDLAVCYEEGIGVQPDDHERRRHLAAVGFLFQYFVEQRLVLRIEDEFC